MKKIVLSAVAASSAAISAHAEFTTTNEVVVTATRIEKPIDQVGSSVEVISNQQIEQSKSTTALQALELVPGLSVRRDGASSLKTKISLRGAPPESTLIMVDGIPMYDQHQMSGFNSSDLGALMASDIEQIEVLKGAQSVLYGSSAMSGVINIVTKKGSEKPNATLFAEYGSLNTVYSGASFNGGDDKFNYSASVTYFDKQGESATDKSSDTSNDDDGLKSETARVKIGITPTETTEFNVFATYTKARSDYDETPAYGGGDGSNLHQDQEQFIIGANAKTLLFDEIWEPKISASISKTDRDQVDNWPAWFDSKTTKADFQNTLFLNNYNTIVLGSDWYKDDYKANEVPKGDLENVGVYGLYQFSPIDPWTNTIGFRHDNHSSFGSETTYQLTTSYFIEQTGTRLHSSWGTGFKAPNSYQLYFTSPWSSGNPDLEAQTSKSWDFGIDQEIMEDLLTVGVTYFNSKYEDMINWDNSIYTYNNIDVVKSQGVETYIEMTPSEKLLLKLSYVYADNDTDGNDIIPPHEFGFYINYAATEKWNINLNGQHVDSTKYSDNYTLINTSSSYQITDNVQVYGRLTNLLGEEYELSEGYREDGFGAYAGVRIDL